MATDKKAPSKLARAESPPLPAAVSALLPDPEVVQQLPPAVQDAFTSKVADFCERTIRAIDGGVAALAPPSRAVDDGGAAGKARAVEDAVLADMARLRGVPLAREFVDMTLWRRLRNANNRVVATVEAACDAAGPGSAAAIAGGSASEGTRMQGRGLSFRQVHMETLTERFADDLSKLHEGEKMTGERVQFLLRCLEEGADLFAGLRVDLAG
jgi:hypothetical protein